MDYFEFIKNNDKTVEELKEYYQSEYPIYYELWDYGFWKANDKTAVGPLGRTGQPKSRCTSVGMAISLYLTAYVHIKKPKSIIEYGSGFTTFLFSTMLEDLDYGGSLITFEEHEGFYKMADAIGFYEKMNGNNRVELGPLKFETNSDKKYCYYDYDLNKIDSVDFVFDDGPDLIRYKCNASMCMLNLKKHFDSSFDFLIDGRIGQQEYYKSIYGEKVKQSWIGLDKESEFLREDGYMCGIGTL